MNESSTSEGRNEPEEAGAPQPASGHPQPATPQPSEPGAFGSGDDPSVVPPAASQPGPASELPPPSPADVGGWQYQPGPAAGPDPHFNPGAGSGGTSGGYPPPPGYGGGHPYPPASPYPPGNLYPPASPYPPGNLYPPSSPYPPGDVYAAGGGAGQGPGGPGGTWSPNPQWAAPVPPRRPRRGFRPLAAAALAVAIAAAGVGIGHVAWGSGTSPSTPITARTPSGSGNTGSGSTGSGGVTNPFGNGGSSGNSNGSDPFGNGGFFQQPGSSNSGATQPGAGAPSDVNAIAAKVDPALVDFNVTFSYQGAGGAATGIVLTSNGEILTNNHVVEGATSIHVTDLGNGKTYTGTVVGYDRSADVAVVQLKGASGLKTAKLANSSKVTVGEGVVAIGNAGGKGGTPTAAGGSIIGLNKDITASDELTGGNENLTGLLETNADVQEGDSGGSLVNSSGQVIGMDTAGSGTYSLSTQGSQGFAIPINKALAIASQIESGRSSTTVHVGPTAFLGVLVSASSSPSDPYSSAPNGGSTTSGVEVSGVTSGGAAQRAGLSQGDVITSLGGHTITAASDLTNLLVEQYKPGDSVTIGWTDTSGQTHTSTVTLGSGPAQ